MKKPRKGKKVRRIVLMRGYTDLASWSPSRYAGSLLVSLNDTKWTEREHLYELQLVEVLPSRER